jgi:hypothetical protein
MDWIASDRNRLDWIGSDRNRLDWIIWAHSGVSVLQNTYSYPRRSVGRAGAERETIDNCPNICFLKAKDGAWTLAPFLGPKQLGKTGTNEEHVRQIRSKNKQKCPDSQKDPVCWRQKPL